MCLTSSLAITKTSLWNRFKIPTSKSHKLSDFRFFICKVKVLKHAVTTYSWLPHAFLGCFHKYYLIYQSSYPHLIEFHGNTPEFSRDYSGDQLHLKRHKSTSQIPVVWSRFADIFLRWREVVMSHSLPCSLSFLCKPLGFSRHHPPAPSPLTQTTPLLLLKTNQKKQI